MKFSYQYILVLGSNLGDRSKILDKAIYEISQKKIEIKAVTEPVETTPYLMNMQADFLNQGVLLETTSPPHELLSILKKIEYELGKQKFHRYGPRKIDIDIAWWSEGAYLDKTLEIPHIHNRSRPWVRKFISELIPQAIDVYSNIKYKDMPSMGLKGAADFKAKKAKKEKITILTCYDYTMANLLAKTSLDAVLVGDSLGNVIQGKKRTLHVSLKDMIYHTRCVRRGLPDTFLIVDMPFMSCKISAETALQNAAQVVKKTNCDALKIEGANLHLPFIHKIIDAGIPVMGHLGLEPQMFLRESGYKLQAQTAGEKEKMLEKARRLEESGCFAIVLEMVPASFAKKLSSHLKIPVIGIGAGVHTDGQVLVLQDLLGMNSDFDTRFSRKYLNLSKDIPKAVEKFCRDVRQANFPSADESF